VLIENVAQLLDHGHVPARRLVLDILAHALRAADPYRAIADRVDADAQRLTLGPIRIPLRGINRLFVVGGGKASQRMAEAIEDRLGTLCAEGVVAVKSGEQHRLHRIEAIDASHPIPDERSVYAAGRVMRLASGAGEHDLVITVISGGSSALLCLPPNGVTLPEKRELHRLLLACGAPIDEVNTVRKHVSAIKGGRLAAAALPARVVNFAVSDVVGDPLDCFAGPVVPDSTTVEDAIAVLRNRGLWDAIAPSVRVHLRTSEAESPKTLDPRRVCAAYAMSVTTAGRAALRRAEALGIHAQLLTLQLEGESQTVGRDLARELRRWGEVAIATGKPVAIIASGEMTVTMPEGGGTGGPNQEAGLSAAIELEAVPNVGLAFLGTDGTDGPTAMAGALVDGSTALRAKAMGVDLWGSIRGHDATPALRHLADGIMTGATGANVADLVVGAVVPPSLTEEEC